MTESWYTFTLIPKEVKHSLTYETFFKANSLIITVEFINLKLYLFYFWRKY